MRRRIIDPRRGFTLLILSIAWLQPGCRDRENSSEVPEIPLTIPTPPTLPPPPDMPPAPPIAPGERGDAPAVIAAEEPPLARGIGALTATDPQTRRVSQNAAEIISHSVDVQLNDGAALARVEEAFVNRSNAVVEVSWRFVLPKDAIVTRVALDVNGRIEEGEVLEKKRARRIFNQIVADSVQPKDPALLEWEHGNTFRMSIFPVKPGETRRVFLSYLTLHVGANGRYRYEYPLGGPQPGAARLPAQYSISMAIHGQGALRDVRTPGKDAQVQVNNQDASVRWGSTDRTPQGDFVLEYSVASSAAEVRVRTERAGNGQTRLMAIVNPDFALEGTPPNTPILAIMDTSAGLSAASRKVASATLLTTLRGLKPTDRFGVLACDDDCRDIGAGIGAPTAERMALVARNLESIPPGGSSNLMGALQTAFAKVPSGGHLRIAVFTDGVITSGTRAPADLLRLLSQTKPSGATVFTVGVGPDVNMPLLRRIAAVSGGAATTLATDEDIESAGYRLLQHLQGAGLHNVTLSFSDVGASGIDIVDAYPSEVGFLPRGQELAITAQLRGVLPANGEWRELRLSGRRDSGKIVEKTFRIHLTPAGDAGFVERIWARDHIESLMFEGGRDAEVVEVSRTHRVASPLTSWIVLENQRMYDRFKVQRTEVDEWVGDSAAFTEGETEDAAPLTEDLLIPDEGIDSKPGPTGSLGSGMAAPSAPAAAAPSRRAKSAAPMDESKGESEKKDDSMEGAQPLMRPEPGQEQDMPRCGMTPERVRVTIREGGSSRAVSSGRSESLRQAIVQKPLSRTLWSQWVRSLARRNDSMASLDAATRWTAVDGLGTEALTARAGELARFGNRYEAQRAYGSAAEIAPLDESIHLRLAEGFVRTGRFAAAAAHYRSVADMKKKSEADAVMNYLYNLAAAGFTALFRAEAESAISTPKLFAIAGKVRALVADVDSGMLPELDAKFTGRDLVVKMQLSGTSEDLDISIVDPSGRRRSGIWAKNAAVSGLLDPSSETFAINGLTNGSYIIRVGRTTGLPGTPVSGTVTVRAGGERRVLPFTLQGVEADVAVVQYRKEPAAWRCGR